MSTLLEARHPDSGLSLAVEDEGDSWWAYLVARDGSTIVADVWVRNRIPPPSREELRRYRGGPPPAIVGFDGGGAFVGDLDPSTFSVRWSQAGDVVRAELGPLGSVVLSCRQPRGYASMLLRSGPWGNQWAVDDVAEAMGERNG